MNEKYQTEIDNFIQRFGQYKNLRIVLYGIGRYTVTLLDGLNGFNIVGLMDKDSANIGRTISGVPIFDQDTARRKADMIIINTAETYWDVIYNRIRDIGMPVYYINGEKAGTGRQRKAVNRFRNLSYQELELKAERAEIVSFDFFDTLFMRSVCSPKDAVALLEKMFCLPLMQMRDRAKRNVRENYSLDEMYRQIEELESIPHNEAERIKTAEIELEKKLLLPRSMMLSLLKKLLKSGKEVYIITDMYLPKSFYTEVFEKYGIPISKQAILLSNELDANKMDSSLWKYYAEHIVKNRAALHIGDNCKVDVENPLEYGIDTYLAPNAWEMLVNSSFSSTASDICGIYDTCVMGCILSRLFGNPYAMHGTNGVIHIRNNRDMGYCVFGPVIMTFLLWLADRAEADGVRKIVFMSRDGYFLKQDFEHIRRLLGKGTDCCYIGISRQLAMMASIGSEDDLMEYAYMPYTGSIPELLEDRFGITGSTCDENEGIEKCVKSYLPQIKARIETVRTNYLSYLEAFRLNDGCAVVDLGYYGNNQRYLNKLLDTDMAGYYFNVNLSEKNENVEKQRMKACFQKAGDRTGNGSRVLKKQIYLESFLTAPYGMIKEIDGAGNFLCAPAGKNQKYFKEKEEINEGVIQFIADYIERFGNMEIALDTEYADKYYGDCFDGTMEFSEEVKKSFYNDNAMMNRIESGLFY